MNTEKSGGAPPVAAGQSKGFHHMAARDLGQGGKA